MSSYYGKKNTGGKTASKIENQDSVAAIYALEQLNSRNLFNFGIDVQDFCLKCEGEEDIEIFNLENHIFIQLKTSPISAKDFKEIIADFDRLNKNNTSTDNFFIIASFEPIRINGKNFKEYLDEYIQVLTNSYETDEKKKEVKDELVSIFDLSAYRDIIDKVRIDARPLFKDGKDIKAIFARYLRLNYLFKDPGDVICECLYIKLTDKFAELRRNRGAISKEEIEKIINNEISKGSIIKGLSLLSGYSKIENGYEKNESSLTKRQAILEGYVKAIKNVKKEWRKAYKKELIISLIFGAKNCPQCGHPMMANIMGINGIACPDCGFSPYVTMFMFCECGSYEVVKAQPELDDDKQVQYLKDFFDNRECNVCKKCGKSLLDEYVEERVFYAPFPFPYDEIKNIDIIYKNSKY